MALIAIGDVHGCANTLERLLGRIAPGPSDHLVFVGDYVDRGPDSKRVIDILLRLREQVECTFLKGNHEALMLDYLDYGEYDLWRMNGGATTLSSYQKSNREVEIPAEHVSFIRDAHLYLDTPNYFFVHGGIPPSMTVEEAIRLGDEQMFLWERGHLSARRYRWEKTLVCGHTPRPRPIDTEKLLAIDTGCVYFMRPDMGRLTAVRLPEREFIFEAYSG